MKRQSILLFGATLILQNLMAAIFCSAINIFFHTFGNLDIPGQIAATIVYFAMIYIYTWNRGQKDAGKVHFGTYKKNVFLGLESGLVASIPSIFMMTAFFMTLGKNTSSDIALQFLSRLWFGAFLRVFMWVDNTQYINVLWGMLILLPLITSVAYYCGFNEISLRRRTIYKEDPKIVYPVKDSSAKAVLSEKNKKNLSK